MKTPSILTGKTLLSFKKRLAVALFCGGAIAASSFSFGQLKVLQSGDVTVGGGNTPFPYSQTRLSVNGSGSFKSTLEMMNLNNANQGWGSQIRFTRQDLSGINHIIVDNGVEEMILFPGYSGTPVGRRVTVMGNMSVYGYSSLSGGGYFSDAKLKSNVTPLESSLERVKKLQGVSFNWNKEIIIKTGKDQEINLAESLPKGEQIGFIAQQVEEVVPEVVGKSADGYKTLEYHALTALLVEAMKEQQQQIDKQASMIKELQAKIKSSQTMEVEKLEIQRK